MSNKLEPQSLTFFDPLKEDSSLGRSGLLQSFLGLFSKKNVSGSSADLLSMLSKKEQKVLEVVQYKPEPTSPFQCDTSTSESGLTVSSGSSPRARSYSAQPFDDTMLQRPASLGLSPVYKMKDPKQGNEVEIKIGGLSTIWKDLQKRIAKNNQHSLRDIGQLTSSSSGNELRQYWMPDKHCHECYECNERFTTFRRRHHCRICGHIFCRRCCYQLISGEIIGYAGMVRSCTYCYNLLMSHRRHQTGKRHNSVSIELDGPAEVGHGTNTSNSLLPTDLPSSSATKSQQHVGRSRSLVSMRGSPVDEHSTAMPLMSPGPQDMPNWTSAYDMFDATPGLTPVHMSTYEKEQVSLAKSSIQLHDLWVKMTDENNGMEFRDHRIRLRKCSQSLVGTELVDWLLLNEVATTRDQASIIGQALLDAEWIKHAPDYREKIFYDENCLYQAGKSSQKNPTHDSSSHISTSSSKSFTTPGHSQRSFDRATTVDIGSEPTWVREITTEEDEDTSDVEEDTDIPLWGPATPTMRQFFPESILRFTEEDASSVVSVRSVSSFVEIDNDTSTIKYKRQKHASESGESRKEKLSLKEPRFADSHFTDINAEYIRGYLSWHGAYSSNMKRPSKVGWRESDLFDASVPSHAKQAYYTLQKMYFRHSIQFLKQLFQANDLDHSWAEVIVPLAKRISENVVPNCEVNMDITHYVHIKKLLDGSPKESRLVNGVVFSKNVISDKMRSRIDNPVIMLLATPLEYQRVNYKLASLDPVVRQEPEFFKNLVSRILARHPDLVITQCGVAQQVRKLLRDAGITLLINVKKGVMERLSRCTGADVARSIDQLQNVRLGSCGKFRVQHHYDGRRRFACSDGIVAAADRLEPKTTSSFKTLSYLDGCKITSGCTILLRDKPDYDEHKHADQHTRHFLARVKSVLRFLVRVLYHCKLELSYVMDQQDLASTFPTTGSQKAKSSDQHQQPVLDEPLHDDHAKEANPCTDAATEPRVRSSTYSSLVSDSNTVILDQFDDDGQTGDVRTSQSSESWKQTISKDKAEIGAEQLSNELTKAHHPPRNVDNFHNTVLSFSPLISSGVPYLLTEAGKRSPLYQYLPSILFCSSKFSNPTDCETGCGSLDQASSSAAISTCLNSDYETDRVSIKNRSSTLDSYSSIQGFWSVPDHNLGNDTELPIANYNEEKALKKEISSLHKQEGLSQHHPNPYQRMTSQLSGKGEESSLSFGETSAQDLHNRHSEADRLSNISPKHRRTRSAVNGTNDGKCRSSSIDSPVGQVEYFKWLPEKHPFLTASFTKPADSTEMKDLLADFRANGSSLQLTGPQTVLRLKEEATCKRMLSRLDDVEIITEEKGEHPVDCLAASNHQHISVLFSSYSLQSPNAPYPCVIPWAVDIDFYRGLDITLGAFLERYCFRPSYHCTNTSCNRPMVEHVRSFVHGKTCMNIVLKELSKTVSNPFILSWCWNPESKTSTDVKVMSDDAWSMSFAKFLEFRLETFTSDEHDKIKRTNDDDIVIPPFKSFQYFLYHDIVAAFKCFEIVVYEVALPSHLINFKSDTDWQKPAAETSGNGNDPLTTYQRFVASMKTLSKVGYDSMDQIFDRTNSIRSGNPFDQSVGSDTQEPGEDVSLLKSKRETHFEDLLSLYKQERCLLRDTVDNINLTLQSLRIGFTTENQEEMKTKDFSSLNSSSPQYSHGDETPEEQIAPIEDSCGDVPTMSDEKRSELSADLLSLTCLICRLVDTWNSRMSRVAYQDRLSRKGNRSANTALYNEQPLPLYNGSHDLKDCRLKLSTGTQAVVEMNDDSRLSKANDEGLSFSSSTTSEKTLHKDFENAEENLRCSKADDGLGLVQRKKDDGIDATTAPIPIPTTPLDRSYSVTSSSGMKRFTKTPSTMTMKSFVSSLLSGFNHTQVAIPFPSDEHYLLPNCACSGIVVRDSEPSSIIAYALRTPDCIAPDDVAIALRNSATSSSIDKNNSSQSLKANPTMKIETEPKPEMDDLKLPTIAFSAVSKHQAQSSSSLSISKLSLPTSSNSSPIPSPPSSPRATSPHDEVQFGDSSTKFYCKIYFAKDFKDFRKQILDGSEDQYVDSLSRCTRWAASGGKSGSTFHKTLDDRLVLKQMSRFELQSFLQVAQAYLDYVLNAVNKKLPTALSKILGVYSLSFRNSTTGRSFKQDILVMENLFYKRHINRVFDLKGSVRNRHVKTNGETTTSSSFPSKSSSAIPMAEDHVSSQYDQVLLDENLLTIMREHPLYVREHTKILIKKALSDDAKFLSGHFIIDYSLLVGIDSEKQEIVVGIIDYLRTFTWDKKIEMVVKSYGMIGRQGTRAMPTVVSPEIYRSRFCEAMDRYLQVVPDRWYGMQAFQM